MVPHRCCNRFVRWRQAGVWDRIMDALADRSRREKRAADDGRGRLAMNVDVTSPKIIFSQRG
jgi:transposase